MALDCLLLLYLVGDPVQKQAPVCSVGFAQEEEAMLEGSEEV